MFPQKCCPTLASLFLLILVVAICTTSASQPDEGSENDFPIYLGKTGDAEQQSRGEHDYSCSAEHGVCTALTHCMDGTVHLDGRNYLIDGHKTRLCPHVYDVCCIPDEVRIRQFRQDWQKRVLKRLLQRQPDEKIAVPTDIGKPKLRSLIDALKDVETEVECGLYNNCE